MGMGAWQSRNVSPKWLEGTPWGGLWQTQVPEKGSHAQKSRRDGHLENSQLPHASYPGAFDCPQDTSAWQAFPPSAQSRCSVRVRRLLLTSSSSLRCHLIPLPFRALSSSGPGVTSTSWASCCLSGLSSLIFWISSTWASYSHHTIVHHQCAKPRPSLRPKAWNSGGGKATGDSSTAAYSRCCSLALLCRYITRFQHPQGHPLPAFFL